MIQTADHCTRLLDGFVSQSRAESGRAVRAEPGSFDIRSMVEEAVEIAKLSGPACTFEVDIQEGVEAIQGDRYELLLVLTHLLTNAAAYSPQQGVVWAQVTAQGGAVRFAVSDTGPGIPAHLIDDLFTPFYLTKDRGQRDARGTGLGLCHSKQLVEAHGGRIWLESTLGAGTTVHFEIPA